jgi:TonB-like protein
MRPILIIGVVLVAAGPRLSAQDTISAAKDLYASAAYEDALSTLSRMDGGSTAPEIARQVDQYRAFCLYALGRTREAESIAESMVRKQPLAGLDADASPRLETMFAGVRKRLLPSLIRERFRTARSALDQKNFSDAEPPLSEARLLIVEAGKLGVNDDGLADLGVLVGGFLELIRSAAEQRTSPQPAMAAASMAAGPAAAPRPVAPAPAAAARPAASTAPVAEAGGRIYVLDDEGVSPPVVLQQRMPAMTLEMKQITKALHSTGMIDVVIDEAGNVVDATIRQSLNSSFDTLMVRSALHWKYRPAIKDGVPVRYVKTLVLVP